MGLSPTQADALAASAMAETGAKGLALAVVDQGRPVLVRSWGARSARGEALTPDTVMYGASLTKLVFAYLVRQLAAEGRIDLDRSIADYLPQPLPSYGNLDAYGAWGDLASDERWRRITPRMLLTHSAGFRNFHWDEPDGKLRINFAPGARYVYSGEGIILLQFVLEKGLGLDVEAELQRRVFKPAGMTRTSLKWRPDFAADLADGWKADGSIEPHDERGRVRAAGSMDTTIADMAKLAAFVARGKGLKTAAALYEPMLPITTPDRNFQTCRRRLRPPSAGQALQRRSARSRSQDRRAAASSRVGTTTRPAICGSVWSGGGAASCCWRTTSGRSAPSSGSSRRYSTRPASPGAGNMPASDYFGPATGFFATGLISSISFKIASERPSRTA